MRKLDGIIANCPFCRHDLLVPLNSFARLHFVEKNPQQMEMSVTDGSEGAESEEEISQAQAEASLFPPQGSIPWLDSFLEKTPAIT